jgi:dienelactone hydrolase
MHRRLFLNSSAASATALGVGAVTAPSLLQAAEPGEATPRRFVEQRWALDNIVRANGVDWDQPRSAYLAAPCGVEAMADFAAIRARVQKMADIGPAFESTARRREARARAAEADGATVTARDNWFMAAILYGGAQWPYDNSGKDNIALHEKKRACYSAYAKAAERRVEAVSVPFRGKSIPGWFHLPPGYTGGRIPVVIAIPGMDSFKESQVALTNDKYLSRGMAVLAVDGPGQYESPLLGLYVTMENWMGVGTALVDWLNKRAEVDPDRIVMAGGSFGSFFATIAASNEPRIKACAVIATCLEPGAHMIFEEASPTFKKRFMWMSNYTDEAKFDQFRKTLTWEGHAEKMRSPYLVIGGEADELSPIKYADDIMKVVTAPRQLVVYADARHAIAGVPSSNLGPFPMTLMADWLAARVAGKPFTSERWFVDATGRINKTAL